MKLLLVITDYSAFNNFLSELCVELMTNDLEVHVICSKDIVIDIPDKFSYKDLNIVFHFVPIPRKPSIIGQLKAATKISRIIQEVQPDLVHAHFTTGVFPTLIFKNCKIPYWGTIHGLGMNSTSGLRKLLFTVVERFCFARLDRIFVLNEKDFKVVSSLYPSKASRYSSHGIGCNIDEFDRNLMDSKEATQLKADLGIHDNHFILAYTGRFVAFKGFHVLYHTFKYLASLYPDTYRLILMGGLDDSHPTGLTDEEFKSIASNPAILNIGYTSEISKYLSISDVFVFPSKKEGLPICILEALSMGLPIVTMNERGNCDIVHDQYNGFLINSSEPDREVHELAEAINTLRCNPLLINSFSMNALKDRPKYSRKEFIKLHIRLYQEFDNKMKL